MEALATSTSSSAELHAQLRRDVRQRQRHQQLVHGDRGDPGVNLAVDAGGDEWTLPTITSDASGNFNCNYTLTYPTIDSSNDTTCGNGHLCSVRNDIWVVSGNTVVTQTASFSVEPDGQPPTSIPEAPLPILIPVGIVLIIGAGLVVWRRKLFATS